MFKNYWKYEWVLPVYRYEGLEPLLATLAEKVIAPAEGKVKALAERRRLIEAERRLVTEGYAPGEEMDFISKIKEFVRSALRH